jgi:hypothetical protein
MELRHLCIFIPMRTPLFLNIVGLLTGSAIFASCHFNNESELSFIRRVTKIPIPNDISTISEFDQGELEAGGKYRLEQKDLEGFLSKNNFRPIDRQYLYMSHFNLMGKSGLFPLSASIPLSDKSHLKYFYGCKGGNSWLFTLNEKSGELWVEVEYPDLQGQGPGCKI